MADKRFWKNKRVLITGYEGFLGSNLTRTLLSCGAKIWGLDILTRRKKTLLAEKDYLRMSVIRGNVANLSLVKRIIHDNGIEVIFHLAAEALVGKCLHMPLRAFSSNIEGTWTILEASRTSSTVDSIVVASSDKAYGNNDKLPYKEGYPLAGSFPYDVSKSCADLLAYTYYKTYGLPVVVTRCGNIFGSGDFNFSRIVSGAIKSVVEGKTFVIRSDGRFTRDYVYVDDIVNGYILIAEKMKKQKLQGEAFNFSYEKPLSVLELVKKIYKISGINPDYRIAGEVKYEIKHQFLSSKKARRVLAWKSKFTLEEGLGKTLEWYKHNLR